MTFAAIADPLTGHKTCADHGEDVILKVAFDTLGIYKPSYLDIGAFDPFHINNTALLYATGSRGINVEANPKLVHAFHKFRPEDINLWCAIGPKRCDSLRLFIDENPGLSSMRQELVEHLVEIVDVPVWTIRHILDDHANGVWPDLLTIDIEGDDLAVLEQALPPDGDRPTVVCVEWLRCTEDTSQQWREFMPHRRYALFCQTRSNMIWVRHEDYPRLK